MAEKCCEICGNDYRTRNIAGKKYCNKHYLQIKKYGKIKRTIYDPNEFILYNDYAEIILYNLEGYEVARTVIDIEDVEICKQYKWRLHDNGYVITTSKGNLYKLHRLIMNFPKDLDIDHIDGNVLNNKRSNLRLCTHQQNMFNQKTKITNTSGCKGVSWDRQTNKWRATIMVDYKTISLGRHDNFDDAVNARKDAEEKYFGEYKRIE